MNVKNLSNNHLALIGIGSNIDPEKNICRAVQALSQSVEILACSKVWQNPAVGSDGPDYLNAAIKIRSPLSRKELKYDVLLPLEMELERVRTKNKNADRTIDLDILIFDEENIDEEIWTAAHVSIPCAEIMPQLTHPQTRETLKEAASRLQPGENFFVREDLDLCVLYSKN